jgi:hypothetical protein
MAQEKFPSCSKCTALVRFELLQEVKESDENNRDKGDAA